jgi:divalent metal cation (Fe/Co/Zn/Cd) transporter
MNSELTTAVVGLKTLTLVLGGSITFYAVQAYRTTGSRALRALALGFGTVTVGALVAGIVDQLLPVDPALALVVESLFTTVGFAVVLASLYVE